MIEVVAMILRFIKFFWEWFGRKFTEVTFSLAGSSGYLKTLNRLSQNQKYSWAPTLLFNGASFAVASLFLVVTSDLVSSSSSILLNPKNSSPNLVASVEQQIDKQQAVGNAGSGLYRVVPIIASATKTIGQAIFSLSSALCFIAIALMIAQTGELKLEQQLRDNLNQIVGCDIKDVTNDLVIVVGELPIPSPADRSPRAKGTPTPNYNIQPAEIVKQLGKDLQMSPVDNFLSVTESVQCVAKISALLSAKLLGQNPRILTYNDAIKELQNDNSSIKCVVSVGIFDNELSLKILNKNNSSEGHSELTKFTRDPRERLNCLTDGCFAKIQGNEYYIYFDDNGRISSHSSQVLDENDFGFIVRKTRITARESEIVFVVLGGFGPKGTFGAVEAFAILVEGKTQLSPPLRDKVDFVEVYGVSHANPKIIKSLQTFKEASSGRLIVD
jgi:hypothetical protein